MSPRLAFALDTAHRAGRLTLGYFQTSLDIGRKPDQSPVTKADQEAEELIRQAIQANYKGEPILGEEQGETGNGHTRWVVDPIDGTKSFICGVPLYATLLSYEQEGQAILGVAYFPALDEMLYAEKGQGAFCNGRPIRVSTKQTLEESVLSCGGIFSMEEAGRLGPFLALAEAAQTVRSWTDAYGHALVAKGEIEAMCDPIVAPWDVSALSLIVREAGGRFTDFTGQDALAAEAISSNGLLHERLLEGFQA